MSFGGPIVQDRFCIAPTLKGAFAIFRGLIENHPMLKSASGKAALKAAANDPGAFAKVMATRCLFGAGNAIEYPKTVLRIIEQENLRRFDIAAFLIVAKDDGSALAFGQFR